MDDCSSLFRMPLLFVLFSYFPSFYLFLYLFTSVTSSFPFLFSFSPPLSLSLPPCCTFPSKTESEEWTRATFFRLHGVSELMWPRIPRSSRRPLYDPPTQVPIRSLSLFPTQPFPPLHVTLFLPRTKDSSLPKLLFATWSSCLSTRSHWTLYSHFHKVYSRYLCRWLKGRNTMLYTVVYFLPSSVSLVSLATEFTT